jgi:hypothetical protein
MCVKYRERILETKRIVSSTASRDASGRRATGWPLFLHTWNIKLEEFSFKYLLGTEQ